MSLSIHIETIDHADQRYRTCGDWIIEYGGPILKIYVSNLGDWKMEALIAIHEAIEALLCYKEGISGEDVDEFDVTFEKLRDRDEALDGEPGDNPAAPYHKQHRFATGIEVLLAKELGVDWRSYERRMEKLDERA